jgi:uroporphyrinogen decarboxylase
MAFQPDYHHMLMVLENKRPARLPLYEHKIDPKIMEEVLGKPFADLEQGDESDLEEFFRNYCLFYKEMTYDTVSFEVTLSRSLPGHGAIYGGMIGPIQTRDDFEKYPWDALEDRYFKKADRMFSALCLALPDGMKAFGGIGNGVFEISEDLVGFERLAYMMADDPDLFADLFLRVGDLFVILWKRFLKHYGDSFAACRFGDDLGFKTSTLVSPGTIRQHIVPQYQRIIGLIKMTGKPFMWHSCGKIFSVMEDVIDLGISGKHSNEDAIAPFGEWIARYSDRIALLGGIDVDILCKNTPEDIFNFVVEKGTRYRKMAQGYALGSGNSIPDYVPVEGYLAMIRAALHIRQQESSFNDL